MGAGAGAVITKGSGGENPKPCLNLQISSVGLPKLCHIERLLCPPLYLVALLVLIVPLILILFLKPHYLFTVFPSLSLTRCLFR